MSEEKKNESTRFEEWFKSTGYYSGEGFEYHKYAQKIAWIACEKLYTEKIKDLEGLRDAYEARHLEYLDKLCNANKENEMMRGGLEFYGDKSEWCSWDVSRVENKKYHITIADDEELVNEFLKDSKNPDRKYVGGKKAREILKKIDENKKGIK